MKSLFLLTSASLLLASCAHYQPRTVRQQDLDAWTGVSVEALDTHSLWTTIPMKEIKTKDGYVYRYYNNSKSFMNCISRGGSTSNLNGSINSNANAYGYGQNAYGNSNTQIQGTKSTNSYGNSSCSEETVGCNNLFILKKGKVVSYEPKGQCYTDETVRPEGRYRKIASVSPSKSPKAPQPTENNEQNPNPNCTQFLKFIRAQGCN